MKDTNDYSPLHYAASRDHLDVFEFLVNQGVDLQDGIYYESYLHWAARNGHISAVECLVNHKADINAMTKDVEFVYLVILPFIMLL